MGDSGAMEASLRLVRPGSKPRKVAFWTFFAAFAGLAIWWLGFTLAASATRDLPELPGINAKITLVLDYSFTIINLGVAFFLVIQKPSDPTRRLLALGMISAGLGYNLRAPGFLDEHKFA